MRTWTQYYVDFTLPRGRLFADTQTHRVWGVDNHASIFQKANYASMQCSRKISSDRRQHGNSEVMSYQGPCLRTVLGAPKPRTCSELLTSVYLTKLLCTSTGEHGKAIWITERCPITLSRMSEGITREAGSRYARHHLFHALIHAGYEITFPCVHEVGNHGTLLL
jgi:hypothetical protein